MLQIQIRTNIQPGDIGYVSYLHGILYAQEHELDYTFEGYVAAALGEFAISYDELKDYFALAETDGRIVGSIAIVGLKDQTAQLRWFLVHPDARGSGLGRNLLQGALTFCREHGFRSVFLWTISDLKAASYLYREAGFRLTEQRTHEIWGGMRTEERYDLVL